MNAIAKMGRPSKFTPELVNEALTDISHGVTLAEICRRDHMPDRTTFYDWLNSSPELSQQFARARDLGFDAIAEECKEIADDGSQDYVQIDDGEGSPRLAFNAEHVQRSKLRVDTRLKLLAKWSTRYADRQMVVGADGGAVKMEIEHTQVLHLENLDETQRDQLREILEAARAGAAVDVTPKAVSGDGEGE